MMTRTIRCLLLVFCFSLLALVADARLRFGPPYPRRPPRSSGESDMRDENGEIWALLVAGSNGWFNYRHQADVAHAYKTLRKHGIPANRIITMMYDDIARNPQNPFPGKLFNRPGGEDVYAGIQIDYKGSDVTPDNFLAVLSGDKRAVNGGNRRVIESNSDDHVFVYFTDHGATGLIAFPTKILSVKSLNDVLKKMYADKRYDQLVFYLEACESGSMFENVLPSNIDVYALTASNGHESSWGTYCNNPQKLPCLGDLFSVNWIEDTDHEDLSKETLKYQYELVRKETNMSHVMHYGDMSILNEPVADFQGKSKGKKPAKKPSAVAVAASTASVSWPSRDIEMNELLRELNESRDLGATELLRQKIDRLREKRLAAKEAFHSLADVLVPDAKRRRTILTQKPSYVAEPECHNEAVHTFDRFCAKWNQNYELLRYAYVLANLCEAYAPHTQVLIDRMVDKCTADRLADDYDFA